MTDFAVHEHHEFMTASKEAMQNPSLKLALADLGDTLGLRNKQAFAALPDSDAVRSRARAIKDHTLANLHSYLGQLADRVTANGGEVHFAADAEEAARLITGIVLAKGAKTVVKSKSMTTEEIHLNTALEKVGTQVTETDLGEYIVQLAGHRPSHLVAPAIHLTVPQITEILSNDAGEQLPQDPTALTAFARERLRSRFAEADVGISGANFAIAETGSIVLISNEGNARLTTSVPKVHIAIMGMEKVIPRLADLPVMLKVLARAATGQKMSVYTSIISGPRQPHELEGPEEFHLVILDNGRSRILSGPMRESLFCIRCGACLNACPVYRNLGGHAYGGVYSGPIGAVLTPLYDGLKQNEHLPHVSSLCGACQAACPVKIAIPELLIKLREKLQHEKIGTSWMERTAYRSWAWSLRHPTLYRLSTWLATRTMGKVFAGSRWVKRLPGKLHGWTRTRDFPAPATQRFRDTFVSDT